MTSMFLLALFAATAPKDKARNNHDYDKSGKKKIRYKSINH